METLVFKNKDSKQEYTFENKVYFINDKKIIKNLEKPNIKNSDSSFVIKSLNDLHVSDVVQIRVNLSETGVFLVSFQKDVLPEEKREALLKEIATLKSDNEPTEETQILKAKKLVSILDNYSPIYVTFVNNGLIKIPVNDFWIKYPKCPVLVLQEPKKLAINLGVKKEEPKEEKTEQVKKEKPQYQPINLFTMDYFFIFLFAALGSIGFITAVFELMNKQGIGIFLLILAIAFVITETVAMSLTIYENGKQKNPYLRFYLIAYIVVGIIVGIVGGYFISKGLLKTEIKDFDYKKLTLLSSIIASATMLSSVGTSIPTNLIIKKVKNKRK